MNIDEEIVRQVVEEKYKDFGIYRFYAKYYKWIKFSFAIYIALILLRSLDVFSFNENYLVYALIVYFASAVLTAIDHYFIGQKLFTIQSIIENKTGTFISIKTIGEIVDEYCKNK